MAEFSPTLDVAKQTDVGLKRKRNEDFCQFLIPASGGPQEKYGALFVVADGMGAMGGGDVASQSAVEEIIRNYYAPTADDHPLPRLKGALEAANVFVRDQAQKIGLSRIGATAAGMILIPGGEVVLFNVGDSRVYRVRRRYIELLTHDQSVLQTQRDEGAVSDEDARLSRNVNVTSFIGQPTPVTPIYRRAKAQLGDIFVICTDGLWDLVEPYEILDIVQHAPAQAAVHKLVALARRRGAPDNVTVIAVRIGTSPRGKKGWLWFAAAALIIGGGGGLLALTQLNKGGKTVTETVVAVASSPTASNTPGVKWTETPTPIPTLTSPPISIIEPTSTESPTPSDTPLPTNSPTQSPTPTLTRTPTATPTRTPTLTLTNTLPPTATPSPVPSATPTATLTQTFTLVPSPTVTPSPSATTKHEFDHQYSCWAGHTGSYPVTCPTNAGIRG
jgi:serine/threonine protein phosphatase PrpC